VLAHHLVRHLRALVSETRFVLPHRTARSIRPPVAFHGHDDSNVVVVGGGRPRDDEHTALKTQLSCKIRDALSRVTAEPPDVEVRPSGPLAGVERRNVVNRVTVRGNGIQIEQPPGVRDDPEQREAVAGAVAELYLERIRTPEVACAVVGSRTPRR
jgi:phage replication-related protein YjqB (UPF0714/DUF867 family)